MKKTLILLSIVLIAAGCSSAGDQAESSRKGTLSLQYKKDVSISQVVTRASEPLTGFTGYTLTLNGVEFTIPSDGMIKELDPGDYEIDLSNFPEIYLPQFEDPRYSGSRAATVVAGGNTMVDMELTQANAGIFFVYDETLEPAGFGNVIPTVTQNTDYLEYSGSNREAKGYFSPGEITITLEVDGKPVTIGGQNSRIEEVTGQQLWEITLKAATSGQGSLTIVASVKVIESPTDFREFEIGPGTRDGGLSFDGIADRDIIVEFTDGYTETVSLDGEGNGAVQGRTEGIVKTVSIDLFEITVGRDIREAISLKVADGELLLRENTDGSVPLGTVSEMRLMGRDAATLSASYILESDIHMMDIPWTPIGVYSWDSSEKKSFIGSLNGAGYEIRDLLIDLPGEDCVGLFAFCEGARLENIRIASGEVTGGEQVGALVGRIEGVGSVLSGCVNYASVTGTSNAGGLIGQNFVTQVSRCENYGTVKAASTAGGIAAYVLGAQADITYCNNYGPVAGNDAGGIVGSISSGATVTYCNNFAAISGTNRIGGIGGNNGAIITQCINSGEISGTNNIGGIAGQNYSGTIQACTNTATVTGNSQSQYIGGIAGQNFSGYIYTSENTVTATINGTEYVGGITGYSIRGTIQECGNNARIISVGSWTGGICGYNNGNLYSSVNRAEIRGNNYTGGIAGVNFTGVPARNNFNSGDIYGTDYVSGIAGINYGTTSGSRNSGNITGTGQYVGGVNGLGWGQNMMVAACYNTGSVVGQSYVGGVAGALDSNALINAAFNVGTVSGNDMTGALFGAILDEVTTVEDCYWSNHPGPAIGSGSRDVTYFADGTEIPAGAISGWPDESMEHWGIAPLMGTGENGQWWKHHGTPGSQHYPQLWWE